MLALLPGSKSSEVDLTTPAPIGEMSFSGNEEDALFVNDGAGHFEDRAFQARLDDRGDGRSSAFADLDGDGDLDLVLRELQGVRLRLLRNDLPPGRHWLRVRLEGVRSNRMGVGARVRVRAGGRWQAREVRAGHGYLSQGPAEAHFGLGEAARVEALEVAWPSGEVQRFADLGADAVLRVREGAAAPEVVPPRRLALGPPAPPPLTLAALLGSGAVGRPTLVNVWSPGCKPCAEEAAVLSAHAASCGDRLAAVALSAAPDHAADKAAAARWGLRLPLAEATPEQLRLLDHALDGLPLPTTLVFDAQGQLTAALLGRASPAALARIAPCP